MFYLGVYKFEIDAQLMVGDLPARAKCNSLNSHTGFYACSRCLFRGVRCQEHRHTLYPWNDFVRDSPALRTKDHIDDCVKIIERSTKSEPSVLSLFLKLYEKVRLTNSFIIFSEERPYGVIGRSPLSKIISLPEQSVFDYFHICLKIHLPMLIGQWIALLPKPVIDEIDNFLSILQYPHTFTRRPKSITNYSHWKASEMRTFLLYIAFPLLLRLRPSLSDVLISHFSLLFIYIRSLLFFSNRDDYLDMEQFISTYLEQFHTIYGRCNELYSTHALYHLWQQCRDHGGLAYHSTFTLESSLHNLGRLAHGTLSLGDQIAFWYCVDRHFHSTSIEYSSDMYEKQSLIIDYYFDNELYCAYQKQFEALFLRDFSCALGPSVTLAARYSLGLVVFHSLSYTLRKESTSFRVYVSNMACPKLKCFGEILFFFRYCNNQFFLLKK